MRCRGGVLIPRDAPIEESADVFDRLAFCPMWEMLDDSENIVVCDLIEQFCPSEMLAHSLLNTVTGGGPPVRLRKKAV